MTMCEQISKQVRGCVWVCVCVGGWVFGWVFSISLVVDINHCHVLSSVKSHTTSYVNEDKTRRVIKKDSLCDNCCVPAGLY